MFLTGDTFVKFLGKNGDGDVGNTQQDGLTIGVNFGKRRS